LELAGLSPWGDLNGTVPLSASDVEGHRIGEVCTSGPAED
jgi:hypothetical protein